MLLGFIPAFLYMYFFVPFLAVYHGIQGFYPDKLKSVEKRKYICNYFYGIEDARDITFLKLFEQFGEALPQFIPTQDKNRPKADFCPSWFIIFGQQKSCAPIKIFITYGVANSKKMVRNPLNTSRTFFAD